MTADREQYTRLGLPYRGAGIIQNSRFPFTHLWQHLQHHLANVVRTPGSVRRRIILVLGTRLSRHVPLPESSLCLDCDWPLCRTHHRRVGSIARLRLAAGREQCGPGTWTGAGDGCAGHRDVRRLTGACKCESSTGPSGGSVDQRWIGCLELGPDVGILQGPRLRIRARKTYLKVIS